MSMELSNQKKLSEFYEELKRLNIEIVRPDISHLTVNSFFMRLVQSKMLVMKQFQI